MARKANNDNIRKYRKPINLNIGLIIFGTIFVYIIICIVMYFNSKHIVGYQVKTGSLSADNVFEAIALREESVVPVDYSGYVNFYAREGQKVAVGNLVYTVDESGRLSDYIDSGDYGENSMTDADLSAVKSDIVNFASTFQDTQFNSVYDFKYSLQTTVLKLANNSIMQGISDLNNSGNGELVNFCYAANPGIVVYSVDGFENTTADQITAESFNRENYTKTQLANNDLVETGNPVYKQCTSEDWSIVIQVNEEKANELEEAEYVNVKFLKNQDTVTGKVTIYRQSEDAIFCELSFTNSMITFCTDRFLEIELSLEDETGLKLPNSSIVNKEFFLVPDKFIDEAGNNGCQIMRQTYLEDGSSSVEYLDVDVYNLDKDTSEYYLDDSVLRIGDVLLMADSTETYTISKRGSLIGVYNINKGYADFKQIHILYQNDEYAIVESNTNYGLNVYDYIVLDATTVNENDFIYD
ncbi:MAG: HlyD family efflux transporter periplasmic adaptor subunit [Lachnospiraceae bacterium]|nr:HlyD family efflux transporter periplasmic adaptor subunit [Lachnospiraceae bacterium]